MPDIKDDELLRAFTEKPEPLDFVLPGMLAGTVGALVSPGGMGKSFFALQIAAQLSGGPDLTGIGDLKKGGVYYIAAEDPKEAIFNRLHDFRQYVSEEQLQSIRKNLTIGTELGRSLNILDADLFNVIKNKAKGKRLVIIDTLRRFHNEDENASGPMAQVIGKMEAICCEANCSLLFIHHSAKSSVNYDNQAQSSRGSGVLIDNIRWQAQLMALSKKEIEAINCDTDFANSKLVKFRITKQNYGQSMKDIWLARMSGGFLKKIN
jgi:RecA-family ATPase